MRLVYLDEAGISNPIQEPFLTVAGVIVHADRDLTAIQRHLDKLVEKHIPENERGGFVFHAKEIFNGGGRFKRPRAREASPSDWTLDRRLAIARDLAFIPDKFGLPLCVGFVDRANFPATMNWPKEISGGHQETVGAHATAFMSCAMQVEQWMRANASNEICMLIAEDNAAARAIIRDTLNYLQTIDASKLVDVKERVHFPLRKIKEDPLFQTKRKSSPLQIADFCAYVAKRILMGDGNAYYEPYWDALRGQLSVIDDQALYEKLASRLRRSAKRN